MRQPIYFDNTSAPNKIINSTGNRITMTLSNPILLDKYKNYEIGLLNASIVYCDPNVINRYLRFTYNTVNYNMVVPNGIYSLNDLNVMFVILTESFFANSLFYCEGLDSTAQVGLFCNDYQNTQVSFISNNYNIFDILGFVPTNSKFVPQSAVNY